MARASQPLRPQRAAPWRHERTGFWILGDPQSDSARVVAPRPEGPGDFLYDETTDTWLEAELSDPIRLQHVEVRYGTEVRPVDSEPQATNLGERIKQACDYVDDLRKTKEELVKVALSYPARDGEQRRAIEDAMFHFGSKRDAEYAAGGDEYLLGVIDARDEPLWLLASTIASGPWDGLPDRVLQVLRSNRNRTWSVP